VTTPLRVTQVVFDLDGGGLETLVGEMTRRWAGTDIVTSIIALGGREGRVGASIRGLVDQFHVLTPLPLVSMVFPLALARAIRRTRPDVVQLHSGAWFKSALACRIARAPRVVYTEHGREHYDPPLLRALDRRAARWTDVVVPVSLRLARYMGRVVGVEARRIHPIPNGVDTDRYRPAPRRADVLASLSLPPDALIVGSLGRLEQVKRYDRLVDALAGMPPRIEGRPVFLAVFGEGSARPVIEARARELGVADRVRLPGWMGDPVEAHRVLDVFALVSESEGMSVSLLEAMATGTVPVVMDVGANAELAGPELAGQVVPGGDVAAFTRVAERSLADAEGRARLGRLARERAAHRYALTTMLESYERVYRGSADLRP
jgi:glycosyltransferase involved in cell wall biosynthesis